MEGESREFEDGDLSEPEGLLLDDRSRLSSTSVRFLLRVMAIILQVIFSSLDPLGRASFAFVYSLQTWVANGSFLSSSSVFVFDSNSVWPDFCDRTPLLGGLGGNSEAVRRLAGSRVISLFFDRSCQEEEEVKRNE